MDMYLSMKKIFLLALITCALVSCVPSVEPQFDPTAMPSSFPTTTIIPEIYKTPSIVKTLEITQSPTPATAVLVKPIDESTKIRSGPGTNFTSIGILISGEVASVIGKTWDGDWLQISVNNLPGWTDGWVYSQAVKIEGDLNTLTCVSTDTIACDAKIPPENLETAIKNIRFVTRNPDLQVAFKEISREPNADLRDAIVFVDDKSTEYYVDLATNQVIEFTQTQVFPAISSEKLDLYQLREEAERIASESSAQFKGLKESLVYSEGTKDEIRFFFRWEKQKFSGKILPLLQVGLDQSGRIISYLNTLDILN